MNNLITINNETQTVSARSLYEAVGSTERFNAWFERQLQYGFEEGTDYTGCKTFNTLAHQELQDYDLSVDMAKEICMVQKNERAKEVRKYLIDLEKAWNTPELVMARGLKACKQLLDESMAENKLLKADNERMRPKEIFADAVATSNTSILIGELAKLLKQNGVDIGQNRLFNWLRKNKYLMAGNEPTQYSMDRKLFEVLERTVNNPDGSVRITRTTKVTGKGQQYFINKFLGEK